MLKSLVHSCLGRSRPGGLGQEGGFWDECHAVPKEALKQDSCAQSWPTAQLRPSILAVPTAQLLGQSRNFFPIGLFLAPHLAWVGATKGFLTMRRSKVVAQDPGSVFLGGSGLPRLSGKPEMEVGVLGPY